MADFYGVAGADCPISNAKIHYGPGHKPRPNSLKLYDSDRADNISRAYSISSLQTRRTDPVEHQPLHRALKDHCGTYSDVFNEIVYVHVLKPDGAFSRSRPMAHGNVGAVRDLVRQRDHNGDYTGYLPAFRRIRNSVWTFLVTPVDGVWVLIMIHVCNMAEQRDDADPAVQHGRPDGQRLAAAMVRIYDLVLEGIEERRQVILDRLPVILDANDIHMPLNDPAYNLDPEFFGLYGGRGIFQGHPYDSGLAIYMLTKYYLSVIDAEVNNRPAQAWQALHYNRIPGLWDIPPVFENGPRAMARVRGEMLGAIIAGSSLSNNWRAIAAIEVPGMGTGGFEPKNMVDPSLTPFVPPELRDAHWGQDDIMSDGDEDYVGYRVDRGNPG
ncbi:hypothetical protein F4819DRAFT_302379 [Hypoxylon fuscum]|nr:hypothetical protein F4819DRAFT_302379 [Hypoxylon fuscum]